MKQSVPALFLFLIVLFKSYGQVLPAPGARLNYNQIMFEYGKVKGADMYRVEVAEDSSADFTRCMAVQKDSAPATMISNLPFGKKYQWRYEGLKHGAEMGWQGPYHFEIAKEATRNKDMLQYVVKINDSMANAGGLIVNDATHSIFDRRGNLVWYLPKVDWQYNLMRNPRAAKSASLVKQKIDVKPYIFDLRITPYGTVTYLTDSALHECDLNGKMLWEKHDKGPVSFIGEEVYNHVFTRMPNGHYMVLGNQLWRPMPDYCDPPMKRKYPQKSIYGGIEYAKVEFGTAIEYDKQGNVVWSWTSQDYFDPDPIKPVNGDPQYNYILKGHVNSLGIDPDNEHIYMGFRDASRVIKIDKKTGQVVDSWGPKWPVAGGPVHNLNVHRQHDVYVMSNGDLAVYNNNDYRGRDSFPRVLIFSQKPENSGEVVWQYRCMLDSAQRGKGSTGGNIEELKNGNLLVCMGTHNVIFEITRDKKIVWKAAIMPGKRLDYDYSYRLYRAHWVSSLYPCYFICETSEDTIGRHASKLNIRIFNKGSEKDAYDLSIFSGSGQMEHQFTTETLLPNHSAIFTINPREEHVRSGEIVIVVSSQTNPDLKREEYVVVK